MIRTSSKAAWELFRATLQLGSAGNAFQLAAALAFFTLISLAPLLLIVITMIGVFFGPEAARGEVSLYVSQFVGPDAAEFVEEAVVSSRIEEAGILPTLLGVGALLFGATTVFAQMQAALNAMWDVRTRPGRSGIVSFALTRIVSFGMVLVIGFLLLLSFVSTIALAALMRFAEDRLPLSESLATGVDLSVSLVLAILLFATIFKVLPDVRLSWSHVMRGAVLTGVLFVAGQLLISLYLTRTGSSSTYGAAGSLVLILMWVYYSSLIFFYGAAFTRAYVRRGGGIIQPSSGAVKVRTDIVEG